MSRVVFIITLVITLVCAEVVIDNHQLEAKLEFIKNIDDFKTNNPQLVLYPLDRVGMGKQGIRYTIGQRKSGDSLISTLAKDNYWGSLQDVSLTLTYPTSGYGYVVTYVQVNINQSSNYGNAYVVSGGIGQRKIVIVIEGYSVSYFNYQSLIYGY